MPDQDSPRNTNNSSHTSASPGQDRPTTNEAPSQNLIKTSKSRPRARKHHLKLLGPVPDHATTTQPTTSSFLSLPPEIRRIIYIYALTSPGSFLTYDWSRMRFQLQDIAFGLLTACHAIALETQYLHFKLNTVIFRAYQDHGVTQREISTLVRGLLRLDGVRVVVSGGASL